MAIFKGAGVAIVTPFYDLRYDRRECDTDDAGA